MSIPVVAFFNNKGGVGKTSLVYHLAWMYVELGKRVLAADLDPQANLSAAFLTEEIMSELWEADIPNTIYGAITPLIKGLGDIRFPEIIDPNRQQEALPLFDNSLAILAGDLTLSDFEDSLSETWPKCLDRDERSFRVTSAIWRVMQGLAKQHQSDLILMDLGPNLGAINRTALISADYVVIPLAPDLFSIQGLRNLGPKLRQWRLDWKERYSRNPIKDVKFELPQGEMQPVGYVVMQPSMRLDRPVKAYKNWIDVIPSVYKTEVLREAAESSSNHQLGLIKHYHSLIPLAQMARKPIFLLKPADGAIGSHVQNVRSAYQDFENLAKQIALAIQMPL